MKKILFYFLTLSIILFFSLEIILRISSFLGGNHYPQIATQLKSKKIQAEIIDFEQKYGFVKMYPNKVSSNINSDFIVTYKTNQLGFRDGAIEKNKYWLALGDSFTFGEGVAHDQTFVSLFEEKRKTNILNMGSLGHGLSSIHNQLLYYKETLPEYHGCLLFYLRTLYHRVYKDNTLRGKNETVIINRDQSLIFKDIFLESTLHSMAYIKHLFVMREVKSKIELRDQRKWKVKAKDYYQSNQIEESHKKADHAYLEKRSLEFLSKIAKSCKKLYVINISTKFEYSFLENQKEFQYINLHKELSDYAKTNEVSFRYDQHYNKRTHQKIAELLSIKLNQL